MSEKLKNMLREKGIEVRSIPVIPSSYNETERSFEVVASTEAPTMVIDWERWEMINEVLLASGRKLRANGEQVVLLDTHYRGTVEAILGSAREWRTEAFKSLSRIFLTSEEEGRSAETKIKEGHLTDVSVGYRVIKSIWIPEKQSQIIEGKTFDGPMKVVTEWEVHELSLVPIGADEFAKFRSVRAMELGLPSDASDEQIRQLLKQRNNPQTNRKDSQIMNEELVKLQEQLRSAEARLATIETDSKTAKTDLEKAQKRASDVKEIASIAARYADTPGVIELAQTAINDETRTVQQFTMDVLDKVRTAPVHIQSKETEERISVGPNGLMQFGTKPWQARSVKYLNASVYYQRGQKEKAEVLFNELRSEVAKLSDVQKNDELREAAQMISTSGIARLQQYRLMSSLSAGAGGNLVPTPMLAEIFIEVEKWGVARRYFRPIPMSGPGDSLKLDSLTTEAIAYWTDQGSLITAADLAFGQTSLTLKKLAAITSWSTELPEDSAVALLPIVADSIARALRKKEDLAGFIGDGTSTYGSFTGLLNFAGNVVTMATGKTSFNDANADDYKAVRDAVNIDFREGAMWFLSPASVSGLEGLKDKQDRYIYREPAAGLPAMLWGYPIADSVGINAMTLTDAAATKFAAFGNPKNILMGMKREVELYASREGILSNSEGAVILNALQADAEILRATERVGFKGTRANSFAALKTSAL